MRDFPTAGRVVKDGYTCSCACEREAIFYVGVFGGSYIYFCVAHAPYMYDSVVVAYRELEKWMKRGGVRE